MRETNDSTAAVLKVLYIYCNLNKNTLRERISSAWTRHGDSGAEHSSLL